MTLLYHNLESIGPSAAPPRRVRRPYAHRGVTIFAPIFAALCLLCTPATAEDLGGEDATVDMPGDEEPPPQQQADEPEQQDDVEQQDELEALRERARAEEREAEYRDAVERQIQTGQDAVHIYQLAEEMVDEVIADVSELNADALAPAAIRQMNLTPNLSVHFGDFVESTLLTSLANHTDVQVKRCVACRATRSRVEDDDWVVTRGLVNQDDLAREADRLGVNTFVDTRFAFYPQANVVALQVEFFRADDGAVIWSETYRSDATTAAILRTGDRVESRDERVEELERRLDERPYYGYQVRAGGGYIPYDAPDGGLGGMMGGVLLYERFGPELTYLYGIGVDGFANFSEGSEIMGGFLYGTLQTEIFEPNLNRPTFRTGPALGGFVAGNEGNSVVAAWGIDAIFQYRLGAGVSAFYFVPTEFDEHDLGGFGIKGRISFNW